VAATMKEQRAIVRKRTQQLVYLELGRDNGGVMLNLTEQGCGFQAITPVKLGDTSFAFQMSGGRRIAGDGEIVWTDEGGVTGGLRFTNVSLEARKQIRQWLEEMGAPEDPGSEALAAAENEVVRHPRTRMAQPAYPTYEEAAPVRQPRQTPWAESRAAAEQTPPPVAAAPIYTAPIPAAPAPPPEPSPSPVPQFNAWADYAARTQAAPMIDDRASWPALREEISYGNPAHEKSVRFWRGVAVITTLAALAAVLAFYQRDVGRSLIWLGETISGKTKASEVAPDSKNPEVKTDTSAGTSGAGTPAVASTEPGSRQSDATPNRAAESDPKSTKEVLGVKEKQPSTDPGQSVLEQSGTAPKSEPWRGGDTVESLWEGVQSGSISAEMSLAERFARGEGVERNCDQAKVLMRAAANRGSKEARLRLYELESGACE
jgi:PilZ domain